MSIGTFAHGRMSFMTQSEAINVLAAAWQKAAALNHDGRVRQKDTIRLGHQPSFRPRGRVRPLDRCCEAPPALEIGDRGAAWLHPGSHKDHRAFELTGANACERGYCRAMAFQTKTIPVGQLLLDLTNPRHEKVAAQKDAIRALIE